VIDRFRSVNVPDVATKKARPLPLASIVMPAPTGPSIVTGFRTYTTESRAMVCPASEGAKRIVSPPVVQPSTQRSDPIPESFVLLTTLGSSIAALGGSGADGAVAGSAQATRAPGRGRAASGGPEVWVEAWVEAWEGSFEGGGNSVLLGASPPRIEPPRHPLDRRLAVAQLLRPPLERTMPATARGCLAARSRPRTGRR
jgi:hypothetical protein